MMLGSNPQSNTNLGDAMEPESVLDLSPLLCVPLPVLTIILNHLGAEDLARVSRTCRLLHCAAVQDALWRPLYQQFFLRVLREAPKRLKHLFGKDVSMFPLMEQTYTPSCVSPNNNNNVHFFKRYRTPMLILHEERERRKLVNELKGLRKQLRKQRKSYSERFDTWKNGLLSDGVYRLFFYLPLLCLLAFLVMLHARLSFFLPNLRCLFMFAPFSILALALGVICLVTAVLYFPTFRHQKDRVFRCCWGRVLLSLQSMTFSLVILAIGFTIIYQCVLIVHVALNFDSRELDICHMQQCGPRPLLLNVSLSISCFLSCLGIAVEESRAARLQPPAHDRNAWELCFCFGCTPLLPLLLSMLSMLFVADYARAGGDSCPLLAGVYVFVFLCLWFIFVLVPYVWLVDAIGKGNIAYLVPACAFGAVCSLLFVLFSLVMAKRPIIVPYAVVLLPAWVSWGVYLGVVVSLDMRGYLTWPVLYRAISS